MTPKEFEVVVATIEHAMLEAYRRGQADHAAGKVEEEPRFRLSRASRLQLKTGMEKALKTQKTH
jgi:hypothetical protein